MHDVEGEADYYDLHRHRFRPRRRRLCQHCKSDPRREVQVSPPQQPCRRRENGLGGSKEDGRESSCRGSRPLRPGGPSRVAPAQQTQNELKGCKVVNDDKWEADYYDWEQFQPHRGRRHYKGAWKKWAIHRPGDARRQHHTQNKLKGSKFQPRRSRLCRHCKSRRCTTSP
jgi:hypothetical protein